MIALRPVMIALALFSIAACESAPSDSGTKGGVGVATSPAPRIEPSPTPGTEPSPSSAPRYFGLETSFPRRFLVYYAADRKELSGPAQAVPADVLKYGRTPIEIPDELALKIENGLPLFGDEYTTIEVDMKSGKTYAEPTGFMKDIADGVKKSPTKDVLVFVHGFNNSFKEAIQRTASLSFRGRFRGVPVAYSWAATPGASLPRLKAAYDHDEGSAAATQEKFARFLSEIAATTGAQRIHLAAHSMGNRLVVKALDKMPGITKTRISNIMMFAPDVARGDIKAAANSALAVRRKGGEVASYRYDYWSTLYASHRDLALMASWGIHGKSRAGTFMLRPDPVPGVQVVDASDVKCDLLDHAYFDCFESELIRLLHLDGAYDPTPGSLTRSVVPNGDGTWRIPGRRDDITATR